MPVALAERIGEAAVDVSACVAPFRIPLKFSGKNGLALLDQIRTLDKKHLVKKVGAVSSVTLRATLSTLQQIFAA